MSTGSLATKDLISRAKSVVKPHKLLHDLTLTQIQFVQSLSNPHYIHHLAASKYFDDPAFVAYLKYLEYFRQPEYVKYLLYANPFPTSPFAVFG